MSAGVIAGCAAGLTGTVVAGVLISVLTRETEGWINALPDCLLRLARARLPASSRDTLYDEWVAELHVALHGTEGRPLTRLVLGTRYATGLLRSARRVADELGQVRDLPPAKEDLPADAEEPGHLAADQLLLRLHLGVSQPQDGPSVTRVLLGTQLRRLREVSSVTREEAGEAIWASGSKIALMEWGRAFVPQRDVADLLSKYQVTDPQERATLMDLAWQASAPARSYRVADTVPAWLEPCLVLECEASEICIYESHHIPALLQTVDYAEAFSRLAHPVAAPADIEMRVKLLEMRQEALRRPHPFHLQAVIDEAALRRPVGGGEVMRRQLQHIIEVSNLPDVTIQIIPLITGFGVSGNSFSLLRFSDPDFPDVAYFEQPTSTIYLDDRSQVESCTKVMDRLALQAESGSSAVEILRKNLSKLDPPFPA